MVENNGQTINSSNSSENSLVAEKIWQEHHSATIKEMNSKPYIVVGNYNITSRILKDKDARAIIINPIIRDKNNYLLMLYEQASRYLESGEISGRPLTPAGLRCLGFPDELRSGLLSKMKENNISWF